MTQSLKSKDYQLEFINKVTRAGIHIKNRLKRYIENLSFFFFTSPISFILWIILAKYVKNESALSGIYGAFIGAWLAFCLTKYNDSQLLIKSQVNELRQVQFMLISHYQVLDNFQKQFCIKKDNGVLELQEPLFLIPIEISQYVPPCELKNLSFILGSGTPDLLNEILFAQRAFDSFISTLNKRNCTCSEIRREASIESERCFSNTQQFSIAITEMQLSEIKGLDSILLSSIKNALSNNEDCNKKLYTFFKEKYPEEKALLFSQEEIEK